MNVNDEIIAIANILANAGKKPSVALIKSKLTKPTPLPLIVSTLKQWQHEPERIQLSHNETITIEKENQPLEPITMQSLQDAITPLEQELSEIKQLLQQLLQQK